jgi:hypothetical protein
VPLHRTEHWGDSMASQDFAIGNKGLRQEWQNWTNNGLNLQTEI